MTGPFLDTCFGVFDKFTNIYIFCPTVSISQKGSKLWDLLDPVTNYEIYDDNNNEIILTVATTSRVDLSPFQLEVLKQAHVV